MREVTIFVLGRVDALSKVSQDKFEKAMWLQ